MTQAKLPLVVQQPVRSSIYDQDGYIQAGVAAVGGGEGWARWEEQSVLPLPSGRTDICWPPTLVRLFPTVS